MRRILILLGAGLLLALGCSDAPLTGVASEELLDEPALAKHLAAGEIVPVLTLTHTAGDLKQPEGIALDRSGHIYLGLRHFDGSVRYESEIVKIDPDGAMSVLAALGSAGPGGSGVLGLATDPRGNVYAAIPSALANNGVWRIAPDGQKELLPGSGAIAFPNALTFDAKGNLYVSDSFTGTIWRYGKAGIFEVWVQDVLLEPLPFDPFPIEAPGVNGLAFMSPNVLYAANSEKGTIVRIRIAPDGSPTAPEVVAAHLLLTAVDGIAAGVKGYVYGVSAAAGGPPFPVSPLVKIDPTSGSVVPVVPPYAPGDPAPQAAYFDTPTSLAFGTGGARHRQSVFIVNADLFIDPAGSGPGIVEVGVDEAGFMGR